MRDATWHIRPGAKGGNKNQRDSSAASALKHFHLMHAQLTLCAVFSLAPVSWTNCVTAIRCCVVKGGISSGPLQAISARLVLRLCIYIYLEGPCSVVVIRRRLVLRGCYSLLAGAAVFGGRAAGQSVGSSFGRRLPLGDGSACSPNPSRKNGSKPMLGPEQVGGPVRLGVRSRRY